MIKKAHNQRLLSAMERTPYSNALIPINSLMQYVCFMADSISMVLCEQ